MASFFRLSNIGTKTLLTLSPRKLPPHLLGLTISLRMTARTLRSCKLTNTSITSLPSSNRNQTSQGLPHSKVLNVKLESNFPLQHSPPLRERPDKNSNTSLLTRRKRRLNSARIGREVSHASSVTSVRSLMELTNYTRKLTLPPGTRSPSARHITHLPMFVSTATVVSSLIWHEISVLPTAILRTSMPTYSRRTPAS